MKFRIVLYIAVVLLLSSCGSSKSTQQRTAREAEQIVNYSNKYIGIPYRYGGTTTKGFDCSGFVQFVYREFNYTIPRSTDQQSQVGEKIKKTSKLQPGDLVFFRGSNKKKKPGHVGIVVKADGKGNFRFIHASSSRGIIITGSSEKYYKDRYLYARRIIQ
ncbi:NlpC/P60 family protein [Bacteroidales bacterium OttesenSCG-928-M11]|nr:NlpC/P60 family protein [Bacteroidales bacterium OttesenSCG-928-M11]